MISPIKGRRKIMVYLGRKLFMYNTGAILSAAPLLPRGGNYGTGKGPIHLVLANIPKTSCDMTWFKWDSTGVCGNGDTC